jgi:hypothetical protein
MISLSLLDDVPANGADKAADSPEGRRVRVDGDLILDERDVVDAAKGWI